MRPPKRTQKMDLVSSSEQLQPGTPSSSNRTDEKGEVHDKSDLTMTDVRRTRSFTDQTNDSMIAESQMTVRQPLRRNSAIKCSIEAEAEDVQKTSAPYVSKIPDVPMSVNQRKEAKSTRGASAGSSVASSNAKEVQSVTPGPGPAQVSNSPMPLIQDVGQQSPSAVSTSISFPLSEVKKEPGTTMMDVSGRSITPHVDIGRYSALRGGEQRIAKRRSTAAVKAERCPKVRYSPAKEIPAMCNQCGSQSSIFYKCLKCHMEFICGTCRDYGDFVNNSHDESHPIQKLILETGADKVTRAKIEEYCCPCCTIYIGNTSDFVRHVSGHTHIRNLSLMQCPICLEQCKPLSKLSDSVVCQPDFATHVVEWHKNLLIGTPFGHEFSLDKCEEGTRIVWNDFAAKVEAEKARRECSDTKECVADPSPARQLGKLIKLNTEEIREIRAAYRPAHCPPMKRAFVSRDLSGGIEIQPIPVFDCPIRDLTYVTENVIVDSLLTRPMNTFVPKRAFAGVSGTTICCSCTSADQCGKDKCECYNFAVTQKNFDTVLNREYLDSQSSDKFEESIVLGCGGLCKCEGLCSNRLRSDYQRDLFIEIFHDGKLNGSGVRTLVAIPAGRVVAEFVAEVIDEEELHRRSASEAYSIAYAFELYSPKELDSPTNAASAVAKIIGKENMPESLLYLQPFSVGNFARFFNHGCRPNLYPRRYTENSLLPEKFKLLHVATSTIPAGSQLFITYGREYFKQFGKICRCLTPFCASFPVSRSTREKIALCDTADHRSVKLYWQHFDDVVNQRVRDESEILNLALAEREKLEPIVIDGKVKTPWLTSLEDLEKRMSVLDITKKQKKCFDLDEFEVHVE